MSRRPRRVVVVVLSIVAHCSAFDLGGAAVAATAAAGSAALGLSYYSVPLKLRLQLPPEDSSFAVRECEPAAKGRGLFALRPFAEGELVIQYRGDLCSYRDLAERYGYGTINLQGKYVFELRRDGTYIDAGDEARAGPARFINHSSKRPNLEPQIDRLHSLVWFEACREVAAGDELTFDYGERYWQGWPGELLD